MERFLAAAEGNNIDELKKLIRSSEPTLKEMASKWDNYTPLHVACAAGHLNLVQALRELMPDFVETEDKYGLSPLHIAAAQVHAEIVRELLRERKHLCSVKGQDKRIPLHYASENGKLEVMRELLSVSHESVYKTTAEKETALHLAVKNDQFYAVVELVEHLKRHNMEEVINLKNDEGNTALHLAVSVKNTQVVDFLLGQHALRHVVVNVNVYNNSGRTPLDLSGREAGDRAITRSLKRAGAKHRIAGGSSLSLEGESKANIRSPLLVVAGLIVNATYQSVLQAPHFETEVDKTYTKGFLAWYASWMTGIFGRDLAYIVFITGNTFGLLVSQCQAADVTLHDHNGSNLLLPHVLPAIHDAGKAVWSEKRGIVERAAANDTNFSPTDTEAIGRSFRKLLGRAFSVCPPRGYVPYMNLIPRYK
ncbi:hypothetical protein BT93_L3676 [Corymbia citriodora subsp. variegata]|uniref:Uncharacterized protein n=1 Tax=Corymbia citriodora subsp. variegata TaxID=360336 RepID=A0A8T0CHY2_CORYI|nr:hypothetical protein BT93_L3676 [Corymbia citriodora subsp. variegata]